jgi:PII-like signaling protein
MLCLIDTADKIERFLPTLQNMVQEGLVAISDVEVIRYTHRQKAEASS